MSSLVEIWRPHSPTSAGRQWMAVIKGMELAHKYIVAATLDELDQKVSTYISELEAQKSRLATAPIRRLSSRWRTEYKTERDRMKDTP